MNFHTPPPSLDGINHGPADIHWREWALAEIEFWQKQWKSLTQQAIVWCPCCGDEMELCSHARKGTPRYAYFCTPCIWNSGWHDSKEMATEAARKG